MNQRPLFAMFFHRPFSVPIQGIISPSAARLAFPPARFDEAAAFQAVENGIEHAVRPIELAAGTRFDLLDDGVSVALTPFQERQDHGFGGGGHKFFPNHRSTIHIG